MNAHVDRGEGEGGGNESDGALEQSSFFVTFTISN